MSPDKQRIAIDQACGIVSQDMWGPIYKTDTGFIRACPDYLNDLNAMHEAEKVLLRIDGRWKNHVTYMNHLRIVVGCEDIFCATAAQRAEALLRTLGKWEDSQQGGAK